MLNVSMKSMLEAGVHFGHQTHRWNPKMSRYIFGERNGIHILDLQKTVKEIKKAYTFMKDCAKQGKTFLFVGTKKQAKEIIREEAIRSEVSCVYEKWLGGTLTNFETLRKSLKRLEELEKFETDGLFKVMSKKEVSRLSKEKARLVKLLSGIRGLRSLPDIVFIVDPIMEGNALREARKLKIPVVGVCDTNCDPDMLDWPVPGNDDAARSIRLFCAAMADAVIDGRAEAEAEKAAAHQQTQEAEALSATEQQQLEAGGQSLEEPAPEAEVAATETARTEE
ncbi:MAG: 30S ribosomal protein S2 [Elusimicrobia bacterium RIFOXYA2_FULL_58_8]|nr:MAG: 30S ribosomal protein S2 [Elusimicrobia bacterium RIFOXYA12_FULL_57_11]OGS14368.1 MAG: 30S ribosomal protein S2 [Elusimicrobia bacterium RIFOXYA2_FULL_58_8]